jgi:hypothetical protein
MAVNSLKSIIARDPWYPSGTYSVLVFLWDMQRFTTLLGPGNLIDAQDIAYSFFAEHQRKAQMRARHGRFLNDCCEPKA